MDLTDIFSKCKELYEAKLNEDLGTLKVIDPKFLKLFKNKYGHHGKRSAPTLGGTNPVGQESPVNQIDTVTARQASDMFFGEGSKYVGMILRANGQQVLAFSRQPADYKHKQTVLAIIDNKLYTAVEKDADRFNKVKKPFYSFYGDTTDQNLSYNEAKSVLNSVFKANKEAGAKLDALVIGADKERAVKQKARKAAAAGQEPRWSGAKKDDNYAVEKQARQALQSRLEKFKASKATVYNTPEEFMAGAVKEGWMDKVNIGGFNYNLSDDQLRLRDIAKPSGWHKSNSITYRIDTHHSLKLKELSDQLYAMRTELKGHPNEAEAEAKMQTLRDKFPPEEYKVIMGMSGGSIVPQSVEASKNKASGWY